MNNQLQINVDKLFDTTDCAVPEAIQDWLLSLDWSDLIGDAADDFMVNLGSLSNRFDDSRLLEFYCELELEGITNKERCEYAKEIIKSAVVDQDGWICPLSVSYEVVHSDGRQGLIGVLVIVEPYGPEFEFIGFFRCRIDHENWLNNRGYYKSSEVIKLEDEKIMSYWNN